MELPWNNEDKREDEEKSSRKPLVIGIVIAAILILLLAIFLWPSDDEEEPGGPRTGVPQPPGSSQQVPGTPQTPTSSRGPTGTQPGATPTTSSGSRAPTTLRGEHNHEPGGEGAHPDRYEGDDPMVPERGAPSDLSSMAVQKIFTVSLRPGVTWETSFRDHARFFTPELTRSGFKKWWAQDEPEHTLGWRAATDPEGQSTLYAFPREVDEKWLSDNRIRYTYDVRHMLRTENGSSNLPGFRVHMDMVYTDDKWLLDDYSFPIGKTPSIH